MIKISFAPVESDVKGGLEEEVSVPMPTRMGWEQGNWPSIWRNGLEGVQIA